MDYTHRIRHTLLPIAAIFLLVVQTTVSDGSAESSIDSGTLHGRTYSNNYFGLTMQIPENWFTLNQQMMQAVTQRGSRVVVGDDQNLSAAIEAGQKNTANLLMVYEHPPGTPVAFTPSLGCIAEKVGHFPGIRRGRDYLLNMKRLLEMGQLQLEFPQDIKAVNIGGVDFDILFAEMNMGRLTVKQQYYAAIQKGYALCFVATYADYEQYSALKECIESVRFD